MKNKIKLLFVGMFCLLALTACSKAAQEVLKTTGIFDGYSYTPQTGVFTVFLKDWANIKTLQDKEESDGAVAEVGFQDEAGNTFSILATMTTQMIDPQAFAENIVTKNQGQEQTVRLAQTPSGIPCVVYTAQHKAEKGQGAYGILNMIFYHQQVIFDLTVRTKTHQTPAQAGEATDQVFNQLWQYAAFRGWTQELKDLAQGKDPRMPIAISAMREAAKALDLALLVEQTPKLIARLSTQGAHGEITLSIGLRSENAKLITTEAIACLADDRTQAAELQEKYWKVLDEKLAAEKILVERGQDQDPALLMFPKSKSSQNRLPLF